MVVKMFCVYDAKAFAYMPPFTFAEKGMAARAFANMANNRETNIGSNPEDFYLYFIGTFDDQTGLVVAEEHENMGVALSFLKQE